MQIILVEECSRTGVLHLEEAGAREYQRYSTLRRKRNMETEQIEKKGNPYVEAQISGEQHSQLEQWLRDEEPIEIATGLDGKVYLINIKGSQELQKKVAHVLAEHHPQG
jgi:hypothetical protein